MRNRIKNVKGFTLVELLVVIAIIVILFSVILVAVDPAKRLSQSRDAVRRQDVRTILSAVMQYVVDNNGSYPSGIDSTAGTVQILGTGGAGGCSGDIGANCLDAGTVDDCLDLSGDLVDEYLAEIPADPNVGSAANTYYSINKTANGRIEITACDPEIAAEIKAQR